MTEAQARTLEQLLRRARQPHPAGAARFSYAARDAHGRIRAVLRNPAGELVAHEVLASGEVAGDAMGAEVLRGDDEVLARGPDAPAWGRGFTWEAYHGEEPPGGQDGATRYGPMGAGADAPLVAYMGAPGSAPYVLLHRPGTLRTAADPRAAGWKIELVGWMRPSRATPRWIIHTKIRGAWPKARPALEQEAAKVLEAATTMDANTLIQHLSDFSRKVGYRRLATWLFDARFELAGLSAAPYSRDRLACLETGTAACVARTNPAPRSIKEMDRATYNRLDPAEVRSWHSHLTLRSELPSIRAQGLRPDSEGRIYFWWENAVDQQAAWEILAEKLYQRDGRWPSYTPTTFRNVVTVFIRPEYPLDCEEDPAIWKGQSEACIHRGGPIPPEYLVVEWGQGFRPLVSYEDLHGPRGNPLEAADDFDPSVTARKLSAPARVYLADLTRNKRTLVAVPYPEHVRELAELRLIAIDACDAAEATISGREMCVVTLTREGADFYRRVLRERTAYAEKQQTRLFGNPSREELERRAEDAFEAGQLQSFSAAVAWDVGVYAQRLRETRQRWADHLATFGEKLTDTVDRSRWLEHARATLEAGGRSPLAELARRAGHAGAASWIDEHPAIVLATTIQPHRPRPRLGEAPTDSERAAAEASGPGRWDALLDLRGAGNAAYRQRLAGWLDEYATNGDEGLLLLTHQNRNFYAMDLDELAHALGFTRLPRKNPRAGVAAPQPGDRVFVYYNLHLGLWSVRDERTGWVAAHAERVLLADVSLVVGEAGRQRVLREQRKNVHAGMRGRLVAINGDPPADLEAWTAVSYNPYKAGTFVERGRGTPVLSAREAFLAVMDGKAGAWVRLPAGARLALSETAARANPAEPSSPVLGALQSLQGLADRAGMPEAAAWLARDAWRIRAATRQSGAVLEGEDLDAVTKFYREHLLLDVTLKYVKERLAPHVGAIGVQFTEAATVGDRRIVTATIVRKSDKAPIGWGFEIVPLGLGRVVAIETVPYAAVVKDAQGRMGYLARAPNENHDPARFLIRPRAYGTGWWLDAGDPVELLDGDDAMIEHGRNAALIRAVSDALACVGDGRVAACPGGKMPGEEAWPPKPARGTRYSNAEWTRIRAMLDDLPEVRELRAFVDEWRRERGEKLGADYQLIFGYRGTGPDRYFQNFRTEYLDAFERRDREDKSPRTREWLADFRESELKRRIARAREYAEALRPAWLYAKETKPERVIEHLRDTPARYDAEAILERVHGLRFYSGGSSERERKWPSFGEIMDGTRSVADIRRLQAEDARAIEEMRTETARAIQANVKRGLPVLEALAKEHPDLPLARARARLRAHDLTVTALQSAVGGRWMHYATLRPLEGMGGNLVGPSTYHEERALPLLLEAMRQYAAVPAAELRGEAGYLRHLAIVRELEHEERQRPAANPLRALTAPPRGPGFQRNPAPGPDDTDVLLDSEGRKYHVRYEVVEANLDGRSSVVVSNDPADLTMWTPGYPREFQARDLGSVEEQAKIRTIAMKLDPIRLLGKNLDPTLGAPVMWDGPDGRLYALGGNGRTIGFLLAPEDRYRAYAMMGARMWPCWPAREPRPGHRWMLVRVVSGISRQEATQLAAASQASTAAEEGRIGKALSLVRSLNLTLERLPPIEWTDPLDRENLVEFWRANPLFVREILEQMDPARRAAYLNDTDRFAPVLSSVLLGYLPAEIRRPGLFDDTKLEDALFGALPAMVTIRGMVGRGELVQDFELLRALPEAIDVFGVLRRRRLSFRALKTALEEEMRTAAVPGVRRLSDTSTLGLALAAALYNAARRAAPEVAIAGILKGYLAEAKKHDPRQMGLAFLGARQAPDAGRVLASFVPGFRLPGDDAGDEEEETTAAPPSLLGGGSPSLIPLAANPRRERPTPTVPVLVLVFDAARFGPSDARAWAKDHGYYAGVPEQRGSTIRIVQRGADPNGQRGKRVQLGRGVYGLARPA